MKKLLLNDPIIIGKIGSPYGVKGWVKIFSFTVPRENILKYNPWYISQGAEVEVLERVAGRKHGNTVIAQLRECTSPEQARTFTHANILIERSQLPKLKKNEYYWSELIGLKVVTQEGSELGIVIDLLETGSNDVLVVKGNKEYAIPYLPGTVIKEIDINNKTICVDWDVDF